MTVVSPYAQALLERFEGCFCTPGGEVWVPIEDAAEALKLAESMGFRLLGLEGFIVGEDGTIFPAMSRITDYSEAGTGAALAAARTLLAGEWAVPPTDAHADATGRYMIDIVVAD